MERKSWATIIVSAVIIGIAIWLGARGMLPMLGQAKSQWSPFVFSLVGVALYVMASAKTRRNRFDVRYLPDYFFRGAQAVVYLYVVMSVLADTASQPYNFDRWPPNLIGLLVGMFILHVEKAMEGLGQRFEEFLAAVLPRSLAARTSREKQLDQLRAEHKFEDIASQGEALASQIPHPGDLASLQAEVRRVRQTILEGDADGIEREVGELAWKFELLKRSLREENLTVSEILALSREKGSGA